MPVVVRKNLAPLFVLDLFHFHLNPEMNLEILSNDLFMMALTLIIMNIIVFSSNFQHSPLNNLNLYFHAILQMGDIAKDLFSGTVGGAAQLICGHPFDTIKVKLQSQPAPLPGQPPKYAGAMDAVKQTIAAEGPRGLYKGMGAPLATVAAFNALLFTVRGQMEALLRSQPGAPLTVNQQIICGAGAGVAVSFLACPTELIKCR